jgi:glycosyltransferase involved in cell wall biosynthesis
MYRTFAPSPDLPPDMPRPHVCIVTSELVGPFKNGGIGTSMTGLAQTLASNGFPVCVLYTGALSASTGDMIAWRDRYQAIGIHLNWLDRAERARLCGPLATAGFGTPYLVYEWLRSRTFDVIQFNDCMGDGFYCLTAKQLGISFQDSLLCVALHSPSQWVFELNSVLPRNLLMSAFSYAERLSTTCADMLWSPSRYLLDWARDKGFALPAATFVQQYVIPTQDMFGTAQAEGPPVDLAAATMPRELVFFGRIEERKGLKVFCEALTGLNETLTARGTSVTFMGKLGTVGAGDAQTYLDRASATWTFPWSVISDLGQQEAVAYIKARSAVAVMPSPADNSPCTIYEALTFGLPFVAARTGGIPELISPASQAGSLFDYSATALKARLEGVLTQGLAPAAPAITQADSREAWISTFAAWRSFLPNRPDADPIGTVRAVVEHGSEADLAITLASLAAISTIAEIIVIDRAGPSAEASDRLAEVLAGDEDGALLFIRPGATLDHAAFDALLQALSCPRAAGLIPASAIQEDGVSRISPPLGGSVSFSFYSGVAATSCLVLKTQRLRSVLGRHRPIPAAEFMGLLDQAILAGLPLWPYPEVVAHYDLLPVASEQNRAPDRIQAYAAADATERYYINAIGFGGMQHNQERAGYQRAIRRRLSRMGLGWVAKIAKSVLPVPVVGFLVKLLRRTPA